METQRILDLLRTHAPELRMAGVEHLRLFGSVARGEARSDADIDLLADFTPGKRVTLLTLSGLEHRLSHLLGATVEISSTPWMRDQVRNQAVEEAISAF